MRRSLIIASIGGAVYLGSWAALGDRALLNRDVQLIWEDNDIVEYSERYGEALPHVLCTDLTSQESLTSHGRTATVLPFGDCFSKDEGASSVLWDRYQSRSDSTELGLIVGYAVQLHSNPLLSLNDVGLWYYGTDYTPSRGEWVTWAFVGWIPLFSTDWGL